MINSSFPVVMGQIFNNNRIAHNHWTVGKAAGFNPLNTIEAGR